MTIDIAENVPRISYSVAQGVTQTSFAVPFEFFDNSDLNVYVDGTLKTITTNYTVSGGSGTTGTVTMSVTGGTGGSTVILTRDIPLDRTTDFPASGAFQISALNTELDRMVAIQADLQDGVNRSLRIADYDSPSLLILPVVDDRKGKILAFNLSTGNVESGPTIAATQSVADASADIELLADIQDGTVATNAITNVNTIRTDVTTVSDISGNVTIVAGNNANVTTVADISANVTTVAGINANVTTVADISANVTSVADNESNINAVAADATDIGIVSTNIANVNIVAGIDADVTTVADNIASVIAADANATAAAASASAASGSAASALSYANNSSASANSSQTDANAASGSASGAASSASAALSSKTAAETAQAAAEAARDTTYGLTETYPNTAAGLAATVDTEYFTIVGSGLNYIELYLNNGGSAVLQRSLYADTKIDEMEDTQTITTLNHAAAIAAIQAAVIPATAFA
jgi:hypothetical protein